MSKKKGKPAPKKAPKNKSRALSAAPGGRTVQATIFIYKSSTGNKIRTTPQRLYANPGDRIEWSVVNMVDGSEVPVTISWPAPGPWGKDPFSFRGCDRKPLNSGAASGRFKYVVSALDAQEDPEIEIPDV